MIDPDTGRSLPRAQSSAAAVREDVNGGGAKEGRGKASAFSDYDHSNFYYGAGDDPLNLLGALQRLVRGGASQRLLPLLRAAAVGARARGSCVRNRKTGEVQDLINLASYNYLGISYRHEVKDAAIEATREVRPGRLRLADPVRDLRDPQRAGQGGRRVQGQGSRHPLPDRLQRERRLHLRDHARGRHIFCDQYSHASIVDGAILAKSKTVFFRHNNPLDLERKLTGVRGKKLVVVEGVYSMDGDVCVLPEIVDVAKRHGARILIDEAHSTFLFGPNGRGRGRALRPRRRDRLPPRHLLQEPRRARAASSAGRRTSSTTSNAFGRSRFFSCNLAPMIAAGLLAGVKIVENEPQLRARLWSNVAFLRRRFAEEGIDIGKSHLPGHAGDGQQRPQGLRHRGEDPGPRPVPAAGHLSRGAQAQVPPAHLRLRGAHRGAARDRRCRSSPACCAKRGYARPDPLRVPRRHQRVLRVPDRKRAPHPPRAHRAGRSCTTAPASSP